MADESFLVGGLYTRDQVADVAGLPVENRKGGDWATGYSRVGGSIYIFCNVGAPGRTGHNYPNRWDGKLLVWYGKTNTRPGQPVIANMVSGRVPVHLFWRGADRAPFSYAGRAAAVDVQPGPPVQVVWDFSATLPPVPVAFSGSGDIRAQYPVWRRGPPPSVGSRTSMTIGGETSVYLMRLEAPPEVFPSDLRGAVLIKVGMSNDPVRRLAELNWGFPPRTLIRWVIADVRQFPTVDSAYLAEGRALEQLRMSGRWVGGEFGAVSEASLATFLNAI